jgi:hypothetical protein
MGAMITISPELFVFKQMQTKMKVKTNRLVGDLSLKKEYLLELHIIRWMKSMIL